MESEPVRMHAHQDEEGGVTHHEFHSPTPASAATAAVPSSAPSLVTYTSPSSYQDLLVTRNFLWPFVTLCALTLISFGVLRGMCDHNVPDNCKNESGTLALQAILSALERIFLVVAIGDFAYLFPKESEATQAAGISASTSSGTFSSFSSRPRHTIVMHLIALIATIVVSAALSASSVRTGMGAPRIIVAIILIVILIPPLLYVIGVHYNSQQRWKALALFVSYLAFLIANAAYKALHVHHWTWSFIYLIVFYPPVEVKPSSDGKNAPFIARYGGSAPSGRMTEEVPFTHRLFVSWSHASSMIAMGILIQGLVAYGDAYYFISDPSNAGGA